MIEYNRKRKYRERIASGRCGKCGKPREESRKDKTACERCAVQIRQYQKNMKTKIKFNVQGTFR